MDSKLQRLNPEPFNFRVLLEFHKAYVGSHGLGTMAMQSQPEGEIESWLTGFGAWGFLFGLVSGGWFKALEGAGILFRVRSEMLVRRTVDATLSPSNDAPRQPLHPSAETFKRLSAQFQDFRSELV